MRRGAVACDRVCVCLCLRAHPVALGNTGEGWCESVPKAVCMHACIPSLPPNAPLPPPTPLSWHGGATPQPCCALTGTGLLDGIGWIHARTSGKKG